LPIKSKQRWQKFTYLRDLQYGQPLDYPTIDVNIDRELAGQFGLTPAQVGKALVPATSSSRYILENFWMDRKTGVAYQVQVQVPQNQIQSMEALKHFPIMQKENHEHPLLGDVASVTYGKCVGEYDRDNMMRMVSLTANIKGMDLGHVGEEVKAAIARAGAPPRSVRVKVAGQVPVLSDTFSHLFIGLSLALVVIFLDAHRLLPINTTGSDSALHSPSYCLWCDGDAQINWHHAQYRVLYGSDYVYRHRSK
jgi:multidrug efflux pump subunit AcrB